MTEPKQHRYKYVAPYKSYRTETEPYAIRPAGSVVVFGMAVGNVKRSDNGIEKAIAFLRAEGIPSHTHGRRCVRLLKHILTKDEETLFETKQSYFHSLSPERMVATSKRLIIVRPSFFGLYLGHDLFEPTDYFIIPYREIASVVVTRGKILATIHMRILGGFSAHCPEGEVEGLRIRNAMTIAKMLEEIIEYKKEEAPMGLERGRVEIMHDEDSLMSRDLVEARGLIAKSYASKFVWLGVEPVEIVAAVLNVSKEKVERLDIRDITDADKAQADQFKDCVFVCYDGVMSSHVVRFIKETYDVDAYYLKRGISDIVKVSYNKLL